jgi:hypothetical protein
MADIDLDEPARLGPGVAEGTDAHEMALVANSCLELMLLVPVRLVTAVGPDDIPERLPLAPPLEVVEEHV